MTTSTLDVRPHVIDDLTRRGFIGGVSLTALPAACGTAGALNFERAARLAPTVAQSGEYDDYAMPWQVTMRTVGKALGISDERIALLDGDGDDHHRRPGREPRPGLSTRAPAPNPITEAPMTVTLDRPAPMHDDGDPATTVGQR